jgi:hypothetical protein
MLPLTLFDVTAGPNPSDPVSLIILVVIAVGLFASFAAVAVGLYFSSAAVRVFPLI